jgi:heme/copper-type cytochrome/quinol oxidase subunit 3
MSDLSIDPVLPVTTESSTVKRPRLVLITTCLASAAVGMYFVSLLAYYARTRSAALVAGESWLDDSIIRLQPPNIALGTLALSLVFVYWLVWSVRKGDRPNAYVALVISLLLGGATVNMVAFLLADSGLSVRDSLVGMLVYAISGSFIALLLAAMVYLVVVGFRLLGADDPRKITEVATAAGVFWLVTTLVYSVIWYALYITK